MKKYNKFVMAEINNFWYVADFVSAKICLNHKRNEVNCMEYFLFEILFELTAYGILRLFDYLIEVVKNNVDEN